MPTYIYRAKDWQGQTLKGFCRAEGVRDAATYLRSRKLVVLDIREQSAAASMIGSLQEDLQSKKIKSRDYMIFCRHFGAMIAAGLTVVKGLEILGNGEGNKTLKQAIRAVALRVEGGSTLAGAMEQYPKVFPSVMTGMIAAAEVGGILSEVLERLALHYERQSDLEEKVRGAMTYPLVVAIVALIVLVVMFLYILPTYGSMFSSMGIELPLITQAIIGMGDFFGRYWYLILIAVAVAAVILQLFGKTARGQEFIDSLKLRLPIYSSNYKRMIWARFAQTMSSLLSSGLDILSALELSKEIIGNCIYDRALEKVGRDIGGGCSLAESLESGGLFPPMMIEMIRVGEETGSLEGMLGRSADLYERELIYTVDRLATIIEPAIIVFVGFFVGLMVFSIILPLFGIYEGI